MLTIRAMSDGKGYSARHLEHRDYYAEGERVTGRWHGRGAELLGLRGEVKSEDFEGSLRRSMLPVGAQYRSDKCKVCSPPRGRWRWRCRMLRGYDRWESCRLASQVRIRHRQSVSSTYGLVEDGTRDSSATAEVQCLFSFRSYRTDKPQGQKRHRKIRCMASEMRTRGTQKKTTTRDRRMAGV